MNKQIKQRLESFRLSMWLWVGRGLTGLPVGIGCGLIGLWMHNLSLLLAGRIVFQLSLVALIAAMIFFVLHSVAKFWPYKPSTGKF
jgi:hypothetical protein